MKTAAFSDALTYLDDELVNEVRTKRNASRTAWMGWAAAAACLALVIYAGVHLRPAPSAVTPGTPGTEAVTPAQPTTPGERALIYSSDVTDDAACYQAPGAGECGYSMGVRAALDEHRRTGAAYLLAFDLFTEDGVATEEETVAEYRRLAEAGVELFETPVWTYEGPEGTQVPCTVVTAMVTEEELADFPVSGDYGYFFYFPYNGDSSRPEVVPGEALVLPDW